MPLVRLTANLRRHGAPPECRAPGQTVAAALESLFQQHPTLRTYILDDQGAVRQHMAIFLNGQRISDRLTQCDPCGDDDEIDILQSLSGG
ncbi:MAG: MoaD/ThiS family protein [Planctomycetes bacterium]|nr:MoaD/ThiS family protein [Planctomycetota bacterium]